ncbi:MAG: protein kinase [Xanthomonadales bacterium]|nr:protein kinase [Xanthomonadales bacterium]
MRTRLGHYDIVSELGRGGMGVVYKGFEGTLHRYVAIKVLADSLAHDEGIRERFLREARSMAALNDPHIIQIYFIGEDEGQPYFVMEFVEGESLGSMLKRDHRLTVEQAAKIIHQTAMGLATAHDRGVVHRDIKPGNLMISARGAVKIADFGIALSNQDFSKKLTSTGEFVGTPGYLSPEVCLGKPVDQRSDIFSLGIVLFEMLTGKMPFNDESPLGLMLEVVRAEIPDVRELNADVDPDIARILARMIAKDPTERYPSCHELVADLGAHPLVAKGGPITVATRLSPAAATLVGQKTPLSGRVELPATPPPPASATGRMANTRITPHAGPMPPVPGAAPVHRSVLERSGGGRRHGGLAWAVAAILVLGIGGAAWAFRAQVPGLDGWLGAAPASLAAATATGPAQTPADVHDVVASRPPASDRAVIDASVAPAPGGLEGAVASLTSDAREGSGDLAAAASSGSTEAAQETGAGSPAPVEPATSLAGTAPADAVEAMSPGAHAPATPAASADLDGRPQPAAATAAPAPQLARANPPKPAVAKPHVPTVAVVAGGDEVIAAPASEAVIERLQQRGFRVIDAGHTGSDRPDLGSLVRLAGRADAIVLVTARPVGTQDMQFYGQSATLYTVQLGLKVYRTADRTVLWNGRGTQVNFTSLNAADKAHEAVSPMLEGIHAHLDEFRQGNRRG